MKSPLSLNATTRLIESYEPRKLREDWQRAFEIDISPELKGVEKIHLYHCEDSQLDFFLPESVAGSERLYEALQKFDWFYMPDKWEFEEAMKDLADCESLLEVGCGQGFFIEKALKYLKCKSVKGIEFSDEAVKKARSKDLPVVKATLKELIDKGETFDAVCSFQVLEHISSPRPFLEEVLKVLKPGGALIMCVPNKGSFLKYQYNILDMPPHHMTRWCLDTFKYLEKIFPLKLHKSSFEPLAEYHIDGYVNAYGRNICRRFPVPSVVFNSFSNFLKITGLYRFCRGQSLYVRLTKL